MPILRLRRDGSVLMGSSPQAVASPEDMKPAAPRVLSDEKAAELMAHQSELIAKVIKDQGEQITEKMLHQTLTQQIKSARILDKMAKAAEKESRLQAARERNAALVGQLQSLVKGLGIALGIRKQELRANEPFMTDMSEDSECEGTG